MGGRGGKKLGGGNEHKNRFLICWRKMKKSELKNITPENYTGIH